MGIGNAWQEAGSVGRLAREVKVFLGNPSSYLISLEFGLYAGRFVGCSLFLVLAYKVSDVVALRYALLIIGLLQLLSVVAARGIARGCAQVKGRI